ncbi:MAG TPA: amino acid racemase [Puia sp.]|jgi:aspartate racemase|nr:amino acid racemase [Puia sp.]
MDLDKDNVIGIVGGMGPVAGLTLFHRITELTAAAADQEHLSVVMMSFPRHFADRTAFLDGETLVNPAYNVAETIGKLEQAGAKVVGIACNTCHTPAIFDIILQELHKRRSRIKLVHMLAETCGYIRENHPDVHRVGVMCTNGTYKSGTYGRLLREWGYEAILPSVDFQEGVIHKMVYDPVTGIKANPTILSPSTHSYMERALRYFEDRQAEAVVLGCTELSLLQLTRGYTGPLVIIDSTDAMAEGLIRAAKNNHST